MENNYNRCLKIGEVYMIEFEGGGCAQSGSRPGLIIQNNVGNMHSPNIIAVPFTSALKKTAQPTHVLVKSVDSGLRMDSMLLCESPESVSRGNIGRYITTLPDFIMEKCAVALSMSMPLISYLSDEQLISTRRKALSLIVA